MRKQFLVISLFVALLLTSCSGGTTPTPKPESPLRFYTGTMTYPDDADDDFGRFYFLRDNSRTYNFLDGLIVKNADGESMFNDDEPNYLTWNTKDSISGNHVATATIGDVTHTETVNVDASKTLSKESGNISITNVGEGQLDVNWEFINNSDYFYLFVFDVTNNTVIDETRVWVQSNQRMIRDSAIASGTTYAVILVALSEDLYIDADEKYIDSQQVNARIYASEEITIP